MEAVTAPASGTGSKTMADLAAIAAEKFADKTALKHKVGDEWVDTSYTDFGAAVDEVGRGLIDLGLEHGDKVAIVAHTRPEWTYSQFGILAAGTVSVSVYQTNSAEECHYVLEHSESKAVFLEDAEQLEKIRAVRDRLPKLQHIVLFEPVEGADDAITLDELRERGRSHEPSELKDRYAAISPEDVAIYIYTSGTTGPPKGCILSNGNYRDVVSMSESQGVLQPDCDQAEEALYKNVRGIFGGNIRQCNTGAVPIATEILEFFYACGVPVMEGYGMTETATVATVN